MVPAPVSQTRILVLDRHGDLRRALLAAAIVTATEIDLVADEASACRSLASGAYAAVLVEASLAGRALVRAIALSTGASPLLFVAGKGTRPVAWDFLDEERWLEHPIAPNVLRARLDRALRARAALASVAPSSAPPPSGVHASTERASQSPKAATIFTRCGGARVRGRMPADLAALTVVDARGRLAVIVTEAGSARPGIARAIADAAKAALEIGVSIREVGRAMDDAGRREGAFTCPVRAAIVRFAEDGASVEVLNAEMPVLRGVGPRGEKIAFASRSDAIGRANGHAYEIVALAPGTSLVIGTDAIAETIDAREIGTAIDRPLGVAATAHRALGLPDVDVMVMALVTTAPS